MTNFYIFKAPEGIPKSGDIVQQGIHQRSPSVTIIKVQGHITNVYQRDNLNFAILQHAVIHIETVLNNVDPLDRVYAGLTMALHHYSYAAAQE